MTSSLKRRRELYRTNKERREKILKYQKEYRKNHPSRVSGTKEQNQRACRKYRINHPERVKIMQKNWRINNSEKAKETSRKYIEKFTADFMINARKYFPSLVCTFCGQKDKTALVTGISFHEINGKPHEYSNTRVKFQYIIEHHEDFAPICNKHHKKVHLLMKKGLLWGDIVKMWSEKNHEL